ncbi:Ankyrin repeat family protein [Rhynchospora pubera]|uniref:Ankyrin repeat family protein n=1 Tax=Rhynchospora pubera TaxID=906938 RepID=A0AAV8GUP2_9POAL|nr:Ankyrin repeat family protein [Rhynchospora pubera]
MVEIELTTDPSSSGSCAAVNNPLFGSGMHPKLLEACRTSNCGLLDYLCDHLVGPDILEDKTPYGNNALHLAVMLGHGTYARKLWLREPSLLTSQNNDGETPLITALMAGNKSMAKALIAAASSMELPDHDLERLAGNRMCLMLEMVDMCGQNVLHHALRNMPDQDLALHILDKVRQHQDTATLLSRKVSNYGESPMHIACRRGYSDVVEKLLEIPGSSDEGPRNTTAMHTAVLAQQAEIVNKLLKKRPHLASRVCNGETPLTLAVATNNLEMVEIFMTHDPSLAYINGGRSDVIVVGSQRELDESCNRSPFMLAASLGRVDIAKEIAYHCPDSAFYRTASDRSNALHEAIKKEHLKMVDYLLRTPQFQRLINQSDSRGKLPLHCAASMCNTELIRSLLHHKAQDCTAVTIDNENAVDVVCTKNDVCRTRKWNDAYNLLSHEINFATSDPTETRAKKGISKEEQKEMDYFMPHRYATNTSLVAMLIAAVTIVAAFMVPGGYSRDISDRNLALFAKKASFVVFLISDAVAMCSSLAVSFLCILATWGEDLEIYSVNYKAWMQRLMLLAYIMTTVAFVFGLYTVLSPKNLWLALLILALSCILLLIMSFVSETVSLETGNLLMELYR